MNIAETLRGTQRLAQENKSVLLTAVGVVGTVSSSILSFRAGWKASEIVDEQAQAYFEEHPDEDVVDFPWQDKLRMVWTELIPPVGVNGLAIAAIILSNRVDAQKAAGLAAAYGLSEKAFTEYREKVVEKLGETKEKQVRDEIHADRMKNDPVKEVIIAGAGEVLCYDAVTGRYFQSSVEKIRKAENEINREILNHMYASLSQFYEEIGLPPTRYSDNVGWNLENHCEVNFSTQISSDDRPCMVIDFRVGPMEGYQKLY